jgi:hypothetical protein
MPAVTRLEWEKLRPIEPLIYIAIGFDLLSIMFGMLIGPTWQASYLNIMFVLLGMGLSVPTGMLVSPLSEEESFAFSSIGKALLTFASGYLLSKLDGTIADALASGRLLTPQGGFRVVAFLLCFGVGVPTLYMARRQWAPPSPIKNPGAVPIAAPTEKQNC